MPRNSIGAARGAVVASREVRSDKDFYETPVPCATEICHRIKTDFHIEPRVVMEPSAGSGNFIQAIHTVWPHAHVIAVDILAANILKCGRIARRTDEVIRSDILELSQGFFRDVDLFVGNPPFSQAEAHVKHLLAMMREQIRLCFLLPVSFVTTQGRAERLYENPPPPAPMGAFGPLEAQLPLAERPGFTTNGKTDMAEYATYVFQKDKPAEYPRLLPHVWWRWREE